MINYPFHSEHLSEKECAGFSRSFSVLLSAGWTLPRIIDALLNQSSNKTLSAALSTAKEEIKNGKSLAEALQNHQSVFGYLICSIVAAAEPAGALGKGLSLCAEYYEKNVAFYSVFLKKMRYPLLIVIAAAGIITALFSWFIPDATEKISGSGLSLPAPTRITLVLISIVQHHWIILAAMAVVFSILVYSLWYLTSRIPLTSKISWRVPCIGSWIRYAALRRFCCALHTLVASGVYGARSLRLAAEESRSSFLKAVFSDCTGARETASLADSIAMTRILPDIMSDLLKETSSVEDFAEGLKKMSGFYQEKIEAFFSAALLIVEPVVVAIMGLIGTGILVALYLPFGLH